MSTVSTTWSGNIAILTINNPPVNMGNISLRRDLHDALSAVAVTEALQAVVLASAGKHFYAGSDISEFDRPLEEPQLPAVIELIESIPVPVVAAITGLALGGGFELALGCDGRIGDSSARLGFPEVTLGMIPGAGGTVRAGRLLGVVAAIDLVGSARQIDALEAAELGILDQVVGVDQLREEAVAFAAAMTSKRRLRDLPAPPVNEAASEEAIARVTRRARPNVRAGVDMVIRGAQLDAATALREERAIFNGLRVDNEAKNLRYLFFAKRAAAAVLRTSASPTRLKSIAVLGAGTMGRSLGQAFLKAGYGVTLFDVDEAALQRARSEIGEITTVRSLEELSQADLIIEAVYEDMDVKLAVLKELEETVDERALIVTNTSYLDVNEMAAGLQHANRFAGLHFFNPADRNPLVEVIRADATDDATVATLSAVASRLGKVPIAAGIGDGFVANRVYADYRAQAEFLVEDGASPESVDAALTEFGFPIGPFAVGDMSGLDIAWARRRRLLETRDPGQRYVRIPDRLCEAGRLGKKTGAGWYTYSNGASRGTPDPAVKAIIERERGEKAITERSFTDEEIQARIVVSMLCAAATLVSGGIAHEGSDIDVAMTEGFGFPRWRGGPLRYVSRMQDDELIRWLVEVYNSCPVTFAVAAGAREGVVPTEIQAVLDRVR
jgi:3-hydroxyacyl-CoA dehydrogenase